MTSSRSDRFYWCFSCGRWHDPDKPQSAHLAMYCPKEPPTPLNFDGSDDELKRFIAALKIHEQDDEWFEMRVSHEMNRR